MLMNIDCERCFFFSSLVRSGNAGVRAVFHSNLFIQFQFEFLIVGHFILQLHAVHSQQRHSYFSSAIINSFVFIIVWFPWFHQHNHLIALVIIVFFAYAHFQRFNCLRWREMNVSLFQLIEYYDKPRSALDCTQFCFVFSSFHLALASE